MLVPTALAQSSSTPSAASAVSASPTPSVTRTISATTLPTTLSLPPLNLSYPAIQIDLPLRTSLYFTLNICSLGTNISVIPVGLVSTDDPPSFALGRSTSDAQSGGISSSNRVSRNGSPWQLEWERGFANWTRSGDGEVGTSVLIGLGIGNDGNVDLGTIPEDLGNVIVQISLSTLGEISLSGFARY